MVCKDPPVPMSSGDFGCLDCELSEVPSAEIAFVWGEECSSRSHVHNRWKPCSRTFKGITHDIGHVKCKQIISKENLSTSSVLGILTVQSFNPYCCYVISHKNIVHIQRSAGYPIFFIILRASALLPQWKPSPPAVTHAELPPVLSARINYYIYISHYTKYNTSKFLCWRVLK